MKKSEIISGLFCRRCGDENIFKRQDFAQSGNQRYQCRSCKSRQTKPFTEKPQMLPKFSKEKSSVYIVTSGMSETGINKELWATLQNMSGKLDARLIVMGTVEKNPNLMTRGSPLKFPPEIVDYVCRERFQINKNLVVRGDYSIEHAVINPLTSANNCSGTQSEIFGHAQTALRMVATPKNSMPKAMFTTGTVSLPNYSNAARAKRAEFHHSYGALLVEVVGSTYWATQLRWCKKTKSIDFAGKRYSPESVKKAPRLAGIVYGDIHEDVLTKPERAAFWRLCNGAKAKKNIICDVLDFHTGSHHNEGDVIRMMHGADYDIRGETQRAAEFVKSVPNCVLVNSNHHDHIDKWYNRQDRRRLRHELDLYDHMTYLLKKHKRNIFEAWCAEIGANFEATDPNFEYDVGGNDVAQHGHIGPNGARGSLAGFAKTGRKTVIQHSHTPGIDKGAMQVGTSSLSHAYAKGYSSWAVTHGLITETGRRSLLFANKNKYSPLTEEWLSNGS